MTKSKKIRGEKKVLKAWAVVSSGDESSAFYKEGEIIHESLVQVESSDCLCQAELYNSYAIFKSKKEALSYKLSWQKVVSIKVIFPH